MYCHIKMHVSPIKIATLPPLLLSLRLKTCIVSPWWPAGSVESPISTNVPLLLLSPHRNTSTLFLRSKHLIVDKRPTLPAANLRNMMLGMARGTEPLIWASEKSECALQSRIRSLLGPFWDLSSLNSHSGSKRSSSIAPPLPGILYSSTAFYSLKQTALSCSTKSKFPIFFNHWELYLSQSNSWASTELKWCHFSTLHHCEKQYAMVLSGRHRSATTIAPTTILARRHPRSF